LQNAIRYVDPDGLCPGGCFDEGTGEPQASRVSHGPEDGRIVVMQDHAGPHRAFAESIGTFNQMTKEQQDSHIDRYGYGSFWAMILGGMAGGMGAGERPDRSARAGHNGVQGPAQERLRTTRKDGKALEVKYPDGSRKDVSKKRAKEWVPNNDPRAPKGKKQKVKFEKPQPNDKKKRDPTPEELRYLEHLDKYGLNPNGYSPIGRPPE
jgi:hypothetical protein